MLSFGRKVQFGLVNTCNMQLLLAFTWHYWNNWLMVWWGGRVQFKFLVCLFFSLHLLQWPTFFLLNCFSVKHLRSNLKEEILWRTVNFSSSHSLVSAKPSHVIRNLPFCYCAINCAGGEVIKLPSGIVPSFICSGSDLHIWAAGSGGSP